MLKGYEDRQVSVDVSSMPRVKSDASRWELIKIRSYPWTEQISDYHFVNYRLERPPILIVMGKATGDAQRAAELGLPYRTGEDIRAFHAKCGLTLRVEQIGEKENFQTEAWPDAQLKSFVELAFVMFDLGGWVCGEPIKPDILDLRPVNWDESLFQKFIHV